MKQQQQQQQPVQQPEPQSQIAPYSPHQEYEGDTSMYDDYDSSGQRPSSRGSKHHMENGINYGASSSGNPGHGYTIQHSGTGGNQRRDESVDDEDDMW